MFHGNIHYNCGFSIAMLHYQRVSHCISIFVGQTRAGEFFFPCDQVVWQKIMGVELLPGDGDHAGHGHVKRDHAHMIINSGLNIVHMG